MRDETLDAVKGLAIVLMVFGHAVAPGPLREFVYLFHIPVFFIASGWLFHGAEDGRSLGRGLFRRAIRIWWPYVFWATALIACHNLLLAAGVYSAEGAADSVYVRQGMGRVWEWSEIAGRGFRTLFLMEGATGLGAPYWFLSVLFVAGAAYYVLDFCCRRLGASRLYVLSALALAGIFISRYGHGKVLQILQDRFLFRQACTAFALLHLGVLLKTVDFRLSRRSRTFAAAIGIVCCAVLVWLMHLGNVELVENEFPGVVFLLASSVFGWYFLSAVALWIGFARPVVAFIGRQTMPILLLHLLAFKCLDVAVIVLRGDDGILLARPYRSYEGPLWCLSYVVVGVGIPLVMNMAWWKVWRAFRERILIFAAKG